MEKPDSLHSDYLDYSKRLFGQKKSAKFAFITIGVGIVFLLLFFEAWQAGAFFLGIGLLWIIYLSVNISKTQGKLKSMEQTARSLGLSLPIFDPKSLSVSPYPESPKPLQATEKHKGNTLATIAGLLLVVGAFLPWGRVSSVFGTISVNGIDGDGKFILAIGIVILVISLVHLGKQNRMYSLAIVLLGTLSFTIILFVALNIAQLTVNIPATTETPVKLYGGPGPTVIFIGSIIAIISGFTKVPTEI